jgi:NAD+ diphosphatase
MTLPYSRTGLDRAAGLRADPTAAAATTRRTDRVVVAVHGDRLLIDADPATARRASGGPEYLLGVAGAVPHVALDLSGLSEAAALAAVGASRAVPVRAAFGELDATSVAVAAYAVGLSGWHRTHGFCAACGRPTEVDRAGANRRCPACDREHFPVVAPAVITAIEAPGPQPLLLLARHAGAGPDGWALVAGFAEVGESLEEAVRREAHEEVGLTLDRVGYRASQAWPFPDGMMVGFRATASGTTARPDGVEVVEARWFTPAEVAARQTGRPDAIDRLLIHDWLEERAAPSGRGDPARR